MRPLTIHQPSRDAPRELHDGASLWGIIPPETLETIDPATLAAIPGPRLILHSQQSVSDAASALATWSPAARKAFDHAVARVVDAAAPRTVILWPGPGSVLSDAVSTLSFARRQTGAGLLIDPVAWITPPMIPDAPDHLARIADALLLCENIDAVVVRPLRDSTHPPETIALALAPLTARVGLVLSL